MRSIPVAMSTILILLACFSAAADDSKQAKDKEANLLVNGSFEDGPDAGQFVWFNAGATDIKGWTVTKGQLSYIGSYWQHADGKRSLDMHGGPGFGGIKQSFATKKGQKYRVTFSLAGNPLGTVHEKKLGVRAAGKEEQFVFDTSEKTITDMGWTTQVWDFVATDKETTLEFVTLMTEDPNCGPALDNVIVTEVKDTSVSLPGYLQHLDRRLK